MVGAVRTTKPATQTHPLAPSGHHHCPRESTFCARSCNTRQDEGERMGVATTPMEPPLETCGHTNARSSSVCRLGELDKGET